MKKSAIIIFQKNAELGKVKTRLAKDLGDQTALAIYGQLCAYTHSVCKQVSVEKYLYFSNFIPQESSPDSSYRFRLQRGKELGERMSNAFYDLFQSDFEKVLIIGTDCPEITPDLLSEAFARLDRSEVVMGPAEDGGYYLLGMREFFPQLFQQMEWSTSEVAIQTKKRLETGKISYELLPLLTDIDTIEDLEKIKDLIDFSYD
ncbi:TIGR04282 family arsenosugar biosynthesis glycosyltransferase [Algoriphagus sp.]|uniref:TIGR04282 family arsenosugar biosynthesis glycosyltransferase n=1 Tax=Algoriphagus sp. TaxID=1872435 RepID=UPI00260F2ED8|nr:TIGR04282 family arsenosugar biosynthesis glycosyltransferase [Algoriphagus sp.]